MAGSICQCGHDRDQHGQGENGCTAPVGEDMGCSCTSFLFSYKPEVKRCCDCGHSLSNHAFGAKECSVPGCECRTMVHGKMTPGDGPLRCVCGHKGYDHYSNGQCSEKCKCTGWKVDQKYEPESEKPPAKYKVPDAPRTWWLMDPSGSPSGHGPYYADKPKNAEELGYILVREHDPEAEAKATAYAEKVFEDLTGFVHDHADEFNVKVGDSLSGFIKSILRAHLVRCRLAKEGRGAPCPHGISADHVQNCLVCSEGTI